jgi:hypothetical protein
MHTRIVTLLAYGNVIVLSSVALFVAWRVMR